MNDDIPISAPESWSDDLLAMLMPLISDEPAHAAQSRFSSPCQGYEKSLPDLVRELIPNTATAKLFPVEGHSMTGVGILDKCLLIVDTSLTPHHGSIVVTALNGRFVVKQLCIAANGEKQLYSRPKNHPGIPYQLGNAEEVQVWGVVRHAVTSFI